ncbi:septal ring lytic transglycosylase RlpA family l ipoprotein [Desulfonema ishimotonii]|uniref:Probable endolytic peptidoglycan transglycosylase RlpA n=1 Tax=Desulfonema ishimotonii TaxID=45657 RepID=A0A401G0U1_9BACT|nr:septal ring lytic transglycosylase RlpA family protein [Desulfonema ishimotonii]GBC62817.1 septal ring lytic transglycosylase RlpA family l ipoprotein [Desulfonema ishimotonii]
MMKLFIITTVTLVAAWWACGKSVAYGQDLSVSSTGIASYYSDKFHGRKTANGERYNRHAFTAAHRKLRFGTHVIVTNLRNNRKVKVRINDRGPYVRRRVIDLSYAAARKIGLITKGIGKVRVDIVE